MVICSCNVLTDGMVRTYINAFENVRRARDVYCGFGCKERCGQCAQTIRDMIAARDEQTEPSPRYGAKDASRPKQDAA